MDTSHIRPSILPKLALCGHYRSEGDAGAAANRGTRIDGLFREMFSGRPLAPAVKDDEEENLAAWAACAAHLHAQGRVVRATEEECRVTIDMDIGRPVEGTADAVVPEIQTSFDLKSGQVRNYREQQACYALGFMDKYFCEEWTVHLLFCDEERVISHRYTREACETIIQDALILWRTEAPPVINDYCGWCASRFTCEARKESLGQWLSPVAVAAGTPAVMEQATSEQLVSFLLMARDLEDWTEKARSILRERVNSQPVPGVKLVSKRGSRKVEPRLIQAPAADVLAVCAPIPEAKARQLWPELPSCLVTEAPGRVEMHISRPKKSSPTTNQPTNQLIQS
jgi:hypothetical protein